MHVRPHERPRRRHRYHAVTHNPPADGGFKYNPPHGGPAGTAVTQWIEARANDYLERDRS